MVGAVHPVAVAETIIVPVKPGAKVTSPVEGLIEFPADGISYIE